VRPQDVRYEPAVPLRSLIRKRTKQPYCLKILIPAVIPNGIINNEDNGLLDYQANIHSQSLSHPNLMCFSFNEMRPVETEKRTLLFSSNVQMTIF